MGLSSYKKHPENRWFKRKVSSTGVVYVAKLLSQSNIEIDTDNKFGNKFTSNETVIFLIKDTDGEKTISVKTNIEFKRSKGEEYHDKYINLTREPLEELGLEYNTVIEIRAGRVAEDDNVVEENKSTSENEEDDSYEEPDKSKEPSDLSEKQRKALERWDQLGRPDLHEDFRQGNTPSLISDIINYSGYTYPFSSNSLAITADKYSWMLEEYPEQFDKSDSGNMDEEKRISIKEVDGEPIEKFYNNNSLKKLIDSGVQLDVSISESKFNAVKKLIRNGYDNLAEEVYNGDYKYNTPNQEE